MRGALALLALGFLLLFVQSALGTILPVHLVPDMGLLLAVAAALLLGPLSGLLVTALVGFGADMLSGSLLGQQAALRIAAFGLTRALASQLDLRRTVPLMVYAAGLSLLDAAGMAGLSRVFLGAFPLGLHDAQAVLARAALCALAVPPVAGVARGLLQAVSEADRRREMRLETRRPLL